MLLKDQINAFRIDILHVPAAQNQREKQKEIEIHEYAIPQGVPISIPLSSVLSSIPISFTQENRANLRKASAEHATGGERCAGNEALRVQQS
jgi:hypothetical protein